MIGDFLGPGSIGLNLTAATKHQALAVTAEIAARCLKSRPSLVLDALLAREAQGPTGVGHGVAVPHALLPGLRQTSGVFVRLKPAVDYGAVDGAPVDLIFALFSPFPGGGDHLQVLARVARSLRSGNLRQRLRQAATPDLVRALLTFQAQSDAA